MKFFRLLFPSLLLSACGRESLPPPPPENVRIQWVDVRTEAEFAAGHIPGALLLPYDSIQREHPLIQNGTLDPEVRLYLYCRSGRRSAIAKSALEDLGFQVRDVGSFPAAKKLAEQIPGTAE